MAINLKRETPKNGFEACEMLVKAQSSLYDALHLLECIMLYSDIDNDENSSGIKTWKKKIMEELMKHGYTWGGDADEANVLFGESYGVDWR